MPEINHVFSQGKMNKDLDERIVPNGQYRDAMNIQVSTSEGADVGAVQNILGNSTVGELSFIPENSVCVGAVADEKNNNLYWFVAGTVDFILQYNNPSGNITPILVDVNKDVLEFNKNTIITGINIIDNLLLWTDNSTEPKKINIQICQQGTAISGLEHTNLVVEERDIDNIDIRKEHITVIKKAPKEQLVLEMLASDSLLGNWTGSFLNVVQSIVGVGEEIIIEGINVTAGISQFNIGDILLFKNPLSLGILPFQFDIKAEIIENLSGQTVATIGSNVTYNRPANSFKVRIILTNSEDQVVDWQIFRQSNVQDSIFDKQLARFSCRYRYQDGEYSTFAPFSELAFVPSAFNYETKKAYNVGLQNYLQSLVVKNFKQLDILEDVVQIDILYKESNSTNVYIVDKIKFKDLQNITVDNQLTNNWISDTYNVTSDIIYALLPSNQLLRPYDNVPKKALAQEITGNRVVYGNYVQNYNIDEKPMLEAWYAQRPNADLNILFPEKSLKSIRNYQLGVTYLDIFGRETPVFSDSKSSFKIPISESANKNAINFQLTSLPPNWAKSYKVFVKETSNEYYNLAMDRVYRAKDGNLWLSFPSSDRNKVDEETFLILKKQLDANTQVEKNLKYKIISIVGEAPDFIKTKKTFLSKSNGSNDITTLFSDSFNLPEINKSNFKINEGVFKADGGESIDNITEPLSLVFRDTVEDISSDFYEIINVEFGSPNFNIKLDRNIATSESWIYNNYTSLTAFTATELNPNLEIKIYKNIKKNKPQFDGRFFVKIENNEGTEQYVLKSANIGINYSSSAILNTYYLADDSAFSSGVFLGVSGTTGNSQTNTKGKWQENFEFDANNVLDGTERSDWFIDQAYYRGQHPDTGNLDSTSGVQNTPGYGKGVYKENNVWYMEVSFGQINPDAADLWTPGTNYNLGNAIINQTTAGSNNWVPGDLNTAPLEQPQLFMVGSSNNTDHVDQANVVSNIQENKLFKFLGDQENNRYKISGPVVIQKRYNYKNWLDVVDFYNNTYTPAVWSNQEIYNSSQGTEMEIEWNNFARSLNRRVTYIFPFTLENGAEAFGVGNTPSFISGATQYTSILDATYGADQDSPIGIQFLQVAESDQEQIVSSNPAIWETEPKENIDLNIFHEASGCFDITLHGQTQVLDWFNCYSFGNGVESNRIRDDFNQIVIDKGAVVSSTTDSIYKEERRKSGLIYSGLYNSTNGINNLNQFIAAEKITKDINPTYGSIQKLFSRNTDLVSLCEDRVVRILANKDALFNADGNPNLVATTNVLGQTMPFSGDYGISKNPESFVSESYRAYFTDKQRGVVLRLSMDGLTPISQYGMLDYFKDSLKTATNIIGTYDTNKDEYNVSLVGKTSTTISFNEDVKGWSSFKSFVPEQGVSMANDYYTFKQGKLYKHHVEDVSKKNSATINDIVYSLSDGTNPNGHADGKYFYITEAEYNMLIGSLTTVIGVQGNGAPNAIISQKISQYRDGVFIRSGYIKIWNDPVGGGIHGRWNASGVISDGSVANGGDWEVGDVIVIPNSSYRNTFYSEYTPSHVSVLLNDDPSSIKSYKTLKYTGSKSWYAEYIESEKQKGFVDEFIKKEGKWFNFIKGEDVAETLNIKTEEFSFQGLGIASYSAKK